MVWRVRGDAGGQVASTASSPKIAEREHEIAIKTALGAQRIRLAREMVSGTLGFVLIGEAAGALGVLGVTKFATELFYGVSARDPIVVGSVAAFLFAVAISASVWPAWRAASLDPRYVRGQTERAEGFQIKQVPLFYLVQALGQLD